MEVKIFKNTLTIFQGEFNVCNKAQKKKDLQKVVLSLFGVPYQCPIDVNKRFCFNDTKVAQFSDGTFKILQLFFADKRGIRVEMNVKHDTGTSCFRVELIVN